MPGDRPRPSLFDRLPAEARGNVPLLLDYLYGDLINRMNVLEAQFKGRLSNHEADITRADSRLKKIENCPCAVHRDPAHSCVILDVREELAAIRAENSAQISTIKIWMACWTGGLAVIVFLIELAARVLPIFWR